MRSAHTPPFGLCPVRRGVGGERMPESTDFEALSSPETSSASRAVMQRGGMLAIATLGIMKIPLLSALALSALLLSGCSASTTAPETAPSASAAADVASGSDCAGVTIVVDYGILDDTGLEVCADATGPVLASEAIASTNITTTGNADYGDAVVCRVNNRPGDEETVTVEGEEPFIDPCTSMSPAYAFWALWVKSAPDAEWAFAMEGLSTLKAEPGQSIGFVYTTGTGTEPQPPAAP